MANHDGFVLLLVIVFFVIWGVIAFRQWWFRKRDIPIPISAPGSRVHGEAVDLLMEQGYEVIHGKWKVSLDVHVDDHSLGSSMFIDYFAKRGGDYYVVKLAKPRKPLDLSSGSAVREQLLAYALLYDETAGILYVDTDRRKIHKIRFELEL